MEGNKRTAVVSMRVFRRINGYGFMADPLDAARWLLTVANEPDDEHRDGVEQKFDDWMRDNVVAYRLTD